MSPLYEKSVRALMRDMIPSLGLQLGQTFPKDRVFEWFAQHYPLVKEGTIYAHLIQATTNAKSRVHHNPKPDGADDLFFQIDPSTLRLYDKLQDPSPLYPTSSSAGAANPAIEEPSQDPPTGSSEFAYEHDLRDYLAKNLQLIEGGLRLYSDDGVSGIEFPVGGRFIDILAVDSSGGYVIIELKVSRGYDRVVGQLLRYMAWIEEHHAEPGQRVRGVIVAKTVSEDLRLACAKVVDVALYEYELSVSLRGVALQRKAATVT